MDSTDSACDLELGYDFFRDTLITFYFIYNATQHSCTAKGVHIFTET